MDDAAERGRAADAESRMAPADPAGPAALAPGDDFLIVALYSHKQQGTYLVGAQCKLYNSWPAQNMNGMSNQLQETCSPVGLCEHDIGTRAD